MRSLVAEFQDLEDKLRAGGGPKKIEKQHREGKLTARERVAKLIDPGTAFLEVGLLIAFDKYDGQAPGAGVVTGVGRIEGTASLGENGNVGIAGHRDGFFRGLKDIGPGDTIEMVTPKVKETYVVDHVVIVDPSDVSVLRPRLHPSLTLVTCYPFYFVGSAPKRYIVQASLTASEPAKSQVVDRGNADAAKTDRRQAAR